MRDAKMSQRVCVPQPTPLEREHISVLLAFLEAAFLLRGLHGISGELHSTATGLPANAREQGASRGYLRRGVPLAWTPHPPQGAWLYCHPPLSKSPLRLAAPQILALPSDLSSCVLLAQAVLIPSTPFMPWGCALHIFCSCE